MAHTGTVALSLFAPQHAIQSGDYAVARELLDLKADLFATNPAGQTALHRATFHRNPTSVTLLLEAAGEDVAKLLEIKDVLGRTARDHAAAIADTEPELTCLFRRAAAGSASTNTAAAAACESAAYAHTPALPSKAVASLSSIRPSVGKYGWREYGPDVRPPLLDGLAPGRCDVLEAEVCDHCPHPLLLAGSSMGLAVPVATAGT